MGDALVSFVNVMSRGKYKLGESKPAKDAAPKLEKRSYVRDITPDLQALLKVDASARKEVQDWWADVIGHLPRCEIAVDIEARAKTWKKIDANEIFENKFGLAAHERVEAGLPPLGKALRLILLTTDASLPILSEAPSPKVQANIGRMWSDCQEQCNAKIVEFQSRIAAEVIQEIKETFAELKETKEEVQAYRFVAGSRVFKGVVLIAGNIAHAAASWGATSPLAIVLIARESIEIAQIVGKGLADAEDIGRLVMFDLKTIQAAYTEDEADGKLQNNVVESLSGVVSGVLAIEIPNVKNCKTHIKDFDHKVNLLDIDYTKMGAKLAKLREKIDELDKKVAAAKSTLGGERLHKKLTNDEVIKKFGELIEESGLTYSGLFEEVPKVKTMVDDYRKQSAAWLEALSGYEKQTSGWTKHVSTLAALATEIGFGMGHIGGEHVETAVEVANQHLKLGLEAGTIAMNGLADKFLELIGD